MPHSKPSIDIFSKEGIGYNVKYPHEVPIDGHGMPMPLIEWCGQHCKGRWGWFFKKSTESMETTSYGYQTFNYMKDICIVTFESDKDAFWFSMVHGET